MRYVPPEALPLAAAHGLAASTAYAGVSYMQMLEQIATGQGKVFVLQPDTAPVYVLVSVLDYGGEKVLSLGGLWVAEAGTGFRWRTWLKELAELGKAWGCVRVETAVTNLEQLDLLVKMGCEIESVAVRLEI